MSFGENLKELRMSKNMTQDILAQKTDITKASLSNYERDKRKPNYPVAKRLAEALGVTVDYLYTENDSNSPVSVKKRIENIPDRRLKRIAIAFDTLTDEAQLKVIDFAETLTLVPEFKKST